jgi:hypothetical protein
MTINDQVARYVCVAPNSGHFIGGPSMSAMCQKRRLTLRRLLPVFPDKQTFSAGQIQKIRLPGAHFIFH